MKLRVSKNLDVTVTSWAQAVALIRQAVTDGTVYHNRCFFADHQIGKITEVAPCRPGSTFAVDFLLDSVVESRWEMIRIGDEDRDVIAQHTVWKRDRDILDFEGRWVRVTGLDGIDPEDYPKFCDSRISDAIWVDTGEELSAGEIDDLNETEAACQYASENSWEYLMSA